MTPLTTIRDELEAYLLKNNFTRTQFSQISGINRGTISALIHGQRLISIQNLDRIILAMGLEKGSLYDFYLKECLEVASPDWRRLGSFIDRCAELDKLDCIEQLVNALTDNLSYVPLIFEKAERYFQEGKRKAAAILYTCVAESEKYQHSERLALSQYRLFSISLGEDQEENMRAAALFEGYIDRLDEVDQLDALRVLANIYHSLHQWERVHELADKMGRRATTQYKNKEIVKREVAKKLERPLVTYILYSYLLKADVYDSREDYKQALEYVSLYCDTSWIKTYSEEEHRIIEQFKEWGKANAYVYRLKTGEIEVLPDYVEYLAEKENEIIPGILTILQAANKFHFNIDDILERFKDKIEYKERFSSIGKLNQQVMADQFIQILTELTAYYFHTQRHEEGTRHILKCLEFSQKFNKNWKKDDLINILNPIIKLN